MSVGSGAAVAAARQQTGATAAAAAVVGVRALHGSAPPLQRSSGSGARAWSVRGGGNAPNRKERRASEAARKAVVAESQAQHATSAAAATSATAHDAHAHAAAFDPPPQQQEQYGEHASSDYTAATPAPRARPPRAPRSAPAEPTRGDLSHPSSDFFRALPLRDQFAASTQAHAPAQVHAAQPASFSSLGVASHVHTRLAGCFDILAPTPIQCASIPFLMDAPYFTEKERDTAGPSGSATASEDAARARRNRARREPLPRDLIVQDMTGSGKTLSYALPLLSLVDNFKAATLQGVVLAPTRELAVQIWRVMRKLNDIRGAGKRRKAHPLTLRLAVGAVTDEYAAEVRADPCHIIIATPATFDSLLHGTGDGSKGEAVVRPAVNLRHLRMLVLDEVDHLLLPNTAPRVERVLQSLTSTPAHGAMHRLARIVLVSAALSQRVHRVASKWLHRPVTATAAGLLDGWIDERRMLKDKFHISKAKIGGQQAKTDAMDDDAGSDDAAQLAAAAAAQEPVEPQSLEERLAARGIDIASLDEETLEAYAEADQFGSEDEEDAAERAAFRELKRDDEAMRRAQGLTTPEEAAIEAHVVRADEFVLPGTPAAREMAAAAAAAAAATESEAAGEAALVVPEEESLMPLLAEFPAARGTTPFGAPSSLVASSAAAAAAEVNRSPSSLLSSLPSAAEAPVRFLPASMKHLAVHVAPAAKPGINFASSVEERQAGLDARVKLLAQLHALLRPRVAMVFFKRASDAIDCAALLRKHKRMRVELLVSGGGLRAADRLRAIESALHGSVDLILCTDLAARGLDIRGLSHVINMDLPATALDYVHRAGRVERLGGKKGCTVVNVVRDLREETPGVLTPAAPALDPTQPLSFPLPRRKGTFGGLQVDRAKKLAAQLHIDMPAVTIHRGELVPLVVQQHVPRISTPPTPKKVRTDASVASTTVITAAAMSAGAGTAHARAFSTLFGRRAPRSLLGQSHGHSQSRRGISTRAGGLLLHLSTADPNGADVNVVFITPDGERVPVTGKEGENLLALAHANSVELEGACEGSLACSTCHVILPDEYYAKLDTPVDEENDMLDLAFGLTDTSRLGCQVKLTKELEGMEITMPSATRNMSHKHAHGTRAGMDIMGMSARASRLRGSARHNQRDCCTAARAAVSHAPLCIHHALLSVPHLPGASTAINRSRTKHVATRSRAVSHASRTHVADPLVTLHANQHTHRDTQPAERSLGHLCIVHFDRRIHLSVFFSRQLQQSTKQSPVRVGSVGSSSCG